MPAPKRERLLDTAEAIFSREGFKGVSVDRLIEEAGVARMTLYKGFANKDALIAETLRRRGDRLEAHLEAYLGGAGPEPLDQVLCCFDAMQAWSERPEFNGCYFVNTLTEYNDASSEIGDVARRYKRRFLDRLKNLCRETKVEQPDAVASTILVLIEGASVSRMTLGETNSYLLAKSVATDILKNGLRQSGHLPHVGSSSSTSA